MLWKGRMRSFRLPSVAGCSVSDVRLSSVDVLAAGRCLAATANNLSVVELPLQRQLAGSLADLFGGNLNKHL